MRGGGHTGAKRGVGSAPGATLRGDKDSASDLDLWAATKVGHKVGSQGRINTAVCQFPVTFVYLIHQMKSESGSGRPKPTTF